MRFRGKACIWKESGQAQAGNPSELSGYVFGGGLEFTGVLFPLH